jgi:hypothetical protein
MEGRQLSWAQALGGVRWGASGAPRVFSLFLMVFPSRSRLRKRCRRRGGGSPLGADALLANVTVHITRELRVADAEFSACSA